MKKYTIINWSRCVVEEVGDNRFSAMIYLVSNSEGISGFHEFFDLEEVGNCHRHLIVSGGKFFLLNYYMDHGSGRERIQEILFCDDNFQNIIEAEDFDFAVQPMLIKGAKNGQRIFEF
jgi:hypothetical protein